MEKVYSPLLAYYRGLQPGVLSPSWSGVAKLS